MEEVDRHAKHAFSRGFWGHAPPENFWKMSFNIAILKVLDMLLIITVSQNCESVSLKILQ